MNTLLKIAGAIALAAASYVAGGAMQVGFQRDSMTTALHAVRDGTCPADLATIDIKTADGQALAVACSSEAKGRAEGPVEG